MDIRKRRLQMFVTWTTSKRNFSGTLRGIESMKIITRSYEFVKSHKRIKAI